MESSLVHDEPSHGLGFRKLPAFNPPIPSPVSEDLSTWSDVLRLGQGRSGDTIFSRAGVKRSLKNGERGDAVRAIGGSAIDPAIIAVVSVDTASLVLARLAGAGIERSFVYGKGEREERLSRPAAGGPDGVTVIVDSELKMTPIRLIRGDARVAFQGEMKTAAFGGIIAAHQIASRSRIGLEPEREGKVSPLKRKEISGRNGDRLLYLFPIGDVIGGGESRYEK